MNNPKARSLTEVGEAVATTSFHSLLPGGGGRSTLTGGLSHQRINLGGRVSSPLHNWSCSVHFRSHLQLSLSLPLSPSASTFPICSSPRRFRCLLGLLVLLSFPYSAFLRISLGCWGVPGPAHSTSCVNSL
ncbi:hypothetical protein BJX66DRAFT_85532 [Aspergillus keveii]|uniref:Uncharacterized protein n=1 Tax=Aspergillus keveii TaxID=714993 RepID=A0ABR4GEP3_9EURO